MTILSLDDINKFDIVDFLTSIGLQPRKISGDEYWYLSPFSNRPEKKSYLIVNRKLNRWQDFGANEWSSLVDFGVRYYNCTIRELKEKLSESVLSDINVPQVGPKPGTGSDQPIQILHTHPIRSFFLIHYLWECRIPIDVAQKYCVEVQYTLGPQPYYAIGFRADAGGYILRDRYHHYRTQPQSPTLISHQAKDIAIFKECFDMLTFLSFINILPTDLPDLLVLNSESFFESALLSITSYRYKHLFLGNNPIGEKITKIALAQQAGYIDHRSIYTGYTDLNQWVCHVGKAIIQDLNAPGGRSP